MQEVAWMALLTYSLIVFFAWYVIKLFFNENYIFILYILVFVLLPMGMNWLFDFPYGRTGLIIWISATLTAGGMELLYEKYIKRTKSTPIQQLLRVDVKIDSGVLHFTNKYYLLEESKGFLIAVVVVTVYFSLCLLLLP